MKKHARLTILALLVLTLVGLGAAHAAVIPPRGEGQIGIQAVVTLNGLCVHETPDHTSPFTQTLQSGQLIILLRQEGQWAECILSDSVDAAAAGWVDTADLLIDPAIYMTDRETPVYAWNDTAAPVLEVLAEDLFLPILKDDGEWLVVSLHGATGWIPKTAADLPAPAAD